MSSIDTFSSEIQEAVNLNVNSVDDMEAIKNEKEKEKGHSTRTRFVFLRRAGIIHPSLKIHETTDRKWDLKYLICDSTQVKKVVRYLAHCVYN